LAILVRNTGLSLGVSQPASPFGRSAALIQQKVIG